MALVHAEIVISSTKAGKHVVSQKITILLQKKTQCFLVKWAFFVKNASECGKNAWDPTLALADAKLPGQ